jgi:hypothetical protein
VQTIRDCINRYLVREITCVPNEWVLIGLGAKAFEVLAYQFPHRLVIGIRHPTGSQGGQFYRLMPAGKLEPRAKEQLTAFLNDDKFPAVIFNCTNGDCRFR